MMNLCKKAGVLFAVGSLVLLSEYSLADAADVVSSDGSKMKFEYQGDKLRINTGQGEDSYMLLRDGHIYVVTNSDGRLMVIDANQAMGMFGGMAGAATPSTVASEVVSLKATGRMEKHAGISGEVYDLRYVAEDGTEHHSELVLSEDARAKAFSKALSGMAMSLSKSAGKDFGEAANDLQGRLGTLDMGVLRYGDDMRLTAISDRAIDNSRFELPAEPTDLSGLGGLMGGSMSSGQSSSGQTGSGESKKSGGVMSSFLGALAGGGDKKDEAAEDEDEPETEKEGNAIGKTLGKLFGK